MTIVPDTKDWTWVLSRRCPEGGFDAGSVAPTDVAGRVRAASSRWVKVLGGSASAQRPAPAVWSPLEYACHVRDVLRLYDERLALMLTQPDPPYDNWDQDAAAEAGRYGEQDPDQVAGEIAPAAEQIAARFDEMAAEHWSRTGRRSDGAAFTVVSFARYFLHDVEHHLHDVRG